MLDNLIEAINNDKIININLSSNRDNKMQIIDGKFVYNDNTILVMLNEHGFNIGRLSIINKIGCDAYLQGNENIKLFKTLYEYCIRNNLVKNIVIQPNYNIGNFLTHLDLDETHITIDKLRYNDNVLTFKVIIEHNLKKYITDEIKYNFITDEFIKFPYKNDNLINHLLPLLINFNETNLETFAAL